MRCASSTAAALASPCLSALSARLVCSAARFALAARLSRSARFASALAAWGGGDN